MNNTVIISHPDRSTARSLGEQVAQISETLVILESNSWKDMELLSSEYGCTLLLIDTSLCPQNFTFDMLPHDTAILLLHDNEQAEKYLNNSSILNRNATILPSSLTPSLFQHHIQLLLKQRITSRELLRARSKISELTDILLNSNLALHTQQRYMDILAERDGLTGLYNRKHLSTVLRQEFMRSKRYETDLSLLLLDIDHFRDTNLVQGHLFGDFVLNEIASRITSNTRDSDICFRFGSGNFAVILPQTQLRPAKKVAEKLNHCCSSTDFDNGKSNQKVTISIGIASLGNSAPKSPEQFIHMADRAMYQAKSNGRDRYQQYLETG